MIFFLTQDKITFHIQVLIEDKVYTHGYGKGNKSNGGETEGGGKGRC